MFKPFAVKAGAGILIYSCLLAPILALPALSTDRSVQAARDPLRVHVNNVSVLKLNSRIIVQPISGNPQKGRYLGLEPVPENDYASRFDLLRRTDEIGARLPELGAMMTLLDVRGVSYEGEFSGFDKEYLLLKRDGRTAADSVDLRQVRILRFASGESTNPDWISALLAEGRIPYRSALVLQTKSGPWTSPLERIAFIEDTGRGTSVLGKVILAVLLVGGSVGLYFLWKKSWEDSWRGFFRHF